jgi:hypothetical protein
MPTLLKCMLALVASLPLLAACGGGGGGGGGGTVGGGTAAPGTAPTGRLWHNNYALDALSGLQLAPLGGGAPALIDTALSAAPWADGSQYAVTDYRPAARETTITIKQTGSGRVLLQGSIGGYARSPRASPVNKDMLLLTLGENTTAAADHVFMDLRSLRVLDRFAATGVSVDWLPDGRYLRVASDGAIATGTVGGTLSPSGSLNLQGRRLGRLQVNRQGTQLVVALAEDNGALVHQDLWIAGVDGSGMARLTSTNISSDGHWSPDGRLVAFNVDTGFTCNGAGCLGNCEIWYAPSTARAVAPLAAAPGEAARFRVQDSRGNTSALGCALVAWTL